MASSLARFGRKVVSVLCGPRIWEDFQVGCADRLPGSRGPGRCHRWVWPRSQAGEDPSAGTFRVRVSHRCVCGGCPSPCGSPGCPVGGNPERGGGGSHTLVGRMSACEGETLLLEKRCHLLLRPTEKHVGSLQLYSFLPFGAKKSPFCVSAARSV